MGSYECSKTNRSKENSYIGVKENPMRTVRQLLLLGKAESERKNQHSTIYAYEEWNNYIIIVQEIKYKK
jgi:hypothetical protein